MAGESQRVINVIRQAIDQQTGDQVRYTPGVMHKPTVTQPSGIRGVNLLLVESISATSSSASQSSSAYIRGDELLEDIIIPSGMFVQSGDYAVIAVSEGGKAWVDRMLPTSLFDRLVTDFNRGSIGLSDGSNDVYDFGLSGQVLKSNGPDSPVEWSDTMDEDTANGLIEVAISTHSAASNPHDVYLLKSFSAVSPSTITLYQSSDVGVSSLPSRSDHTHGFPATGFTSYGCKAYRGAAQTLTNGNDTTINLTSEEFDDELMHDNSTNSSNIVLKRQGRWMIMGQVGFDANANGTRAAILLIDGTAVSRTRVGASAAQVHRVQTQTVVKVNNTTSVLTMQGSQNSGGDLSTTAGADETWMCAMWLGA